MVSPAVADMIFESICTRGTQINRPYDRFQSVDI